MNSSLRPCSLLNPRALRSFAAALVSVSLFAAPASPPAASAPSAAPAEAFRIIPVDDPNVVGVLRAAPPPHPKSSAKAIAAPVSDLPPGDPVWQTDYPAALRQAAREEKLVLLNFTGSDWCTWCIRLEAAVFSKPEFHAYADQHLVLMKVDFPRKKRLPAPEVAQNARLQQQFRISGLPTLIVVDATGRMVADIGGSARSSPRAFIAALEKQLQR